MASQISDDILLPAGGANRQPASNRFAVFLPIAIALFGIGAILLGGVSARPVATAEAVQAVDPIQTGAITAADDGAYGVH